VPGVSLLLACLVPLVALTALVPRRAGWARRRRTGWAWLAVGKAPPAGRRGLVVLGLPRSWPGWPPAGRSRSTATGSASTQAPLSTCPHT